MIVFKPFSLSLRPPRTDRLSWGATYFHEHTVKPGLQLVP
jgi:hypothetical protein